MTNGIRASDFSDIANNISVDFPFNPYSSNPFQNPSFYYPYQYTPPLTTTPPIHQYAPPPTPPHVYHHIQPPQPPYQFYTGPQTPYIFTTPMLISDITKGFLHQLDSKVNQLDEKLLEISTLIEKKKIVAYLPNLVQVNVSEESLGDCEGRTQYHNSMEVAANKQWDDKRKQIIQILEKMEMRLADLSNPVKAMSSNKVTQSYNTPTPDSIVDSLDNLGRVEETVDDNIEDLKQLQVLTPAKYALELFDAIPETDFIDSAAESSERAMNIDFMYQFSGFEMILNSKLHENEYGKYNMKMRDKERDKDGYDGNKSPRTFQLAKTEMYKKIVQRLMDIDHYLVKDKVARMMNLFGLVIADCNSRGCELFDNKLQRNLVGCDDISKVKCYKLHEDEYGKVKAFAEEIMDDVENISKDESNRTLNDDIMLKDIAKWRTLKSEVFLDLSSFNEGRALDEDGGPREKGFVIKSLKDVVKDGDTNRNVEENISGNPVASDHEFLFGAFHLQPCFNHVDDIHEPNVKRTVKRPNIHVIVSRFDTKFGVAGKKNALIYDPGGDTFDISSLAIEEIISGGEEVEKRMANHFLQEPKRNDDMADNIRALSRVRTACEQLRRVPSSTTERSMKCGLVHELTEFYTRIPKVPQLWHEFFNGNELSMSMNYVKAVAYGALVQATVLSAKRNDMVQELLLWAIASLSLDFGTAGGATTVLILINTTVLTTKNYVFSTYPNEYPGVLLQAFENESAIKRNYHFLRKFEISIMLLAPGDATHIVIYFLIIMNANKLAGGVLDEKLEKGEPYKSEFKGMLIQLIFTGFSSPIVHLRAKVVWVAGIHVYIGLPVINKFCQAQQILVARMRDMELVIQTEDVYTLRMFVKGNKYSNEIRLLLQPLLDKDLLLILKASVPKLGEEKTPSTFESCQNLDVGFWRCMDIIESGDEGRYPGLMAVVICPFKLKSVHFVSHSKVPKAIDGVVMTKRGNLGNATCVTGKFLSYVLLRMQQRPEMLVVVCDNLEKENVCEGCCENSKLVALLLLNEIVADRKLYDKSLEFRVQMMQGASNFSAEWYNIRHLTVLVVKRMALSCYGVLQYWCVIIWELLVARKYLTIGFILEDKDDFKRGNLSQSSNRMRQLVLGMCHNPKQSPTNNKAQQIEPKNVVSTLHLSLSICI